MLRTVIVLSALYTVVQCSGVIHNPGIVPVAAVPAVQNGPVVAATSSQYFERTFNRLVAPPVLEPVIPVAPSPPPVFIQPSPSAAVPVAPVEPTVTAPIQPNVAIAVATAHAAAPVATILLPPYPFGPPPTIGFIPPSPPINVPDEDRKESTTEPTTRTETKTTVRTPETTTQLPSNSDNNFVQALPSNENVNFKQYYAPPQYPQPPPRPKPQKLKTSVEVVPVPLQYISPPPIKQPTHAPIIKHIHTYVPTKIIVRSVSPYRIRTVRRPARIVMYRAPVSAKLGVPQFPQNNGRPVTRDIEPTTFRPFIRPTTKPPRV
ncbi:uncharacterized protein LOC113512757 [Galleria mellonella]|uniref:Uncharacterized protein LOC113512757 n=1 Tax=Galleria mellonella TaxID=7137 RepID=A0A6J1WM14_GALME|nr:uncharacterized protein LOC113512757 [Galleria mellonella]